MDTMSSGLKRRETFQHSKASISDGMGEHKCIRYRQVAIFGGTINAERYIKVLEQHMLPYRWHLLQGRPCVFQQANAKPHTAAITTAWLHLRRVQLLNWPNCSADVSPIEYIWHIIKQIMQERQPPTFQQLKTSVRQEWDQIPTPKL